MARLTSIGFELNSTTADVEASVTLGSNTVQSTTARSGTYASQVTSLVSGTREGLGYSASGSNVNGPYFVRFYFRYATLPSAENTIFLLLADGGMTNTGRITLLSSGALRLRDEDGQIGSDSSVLSSNTWYLVEVQYDRTASAGSHILRARVNGVEFAGASNRNMSVGFRNMLFGGNLNFESQTTGNWYFDDIAINDSSGSFENSWPGAGSIVHLRPNAAGDNQQWIEGASTAYTAVDEVTPNDATDFIAENSSGLISDFNLDATPSAIASADLIKVVQVGVRFNANIASASPFVVRVKAAASGTVEESAAISAASTTWMTNATAAPRNYPLTLYDLPGASTTGWTKSDLDSAQIGVRKTSTTGSDAQVSTLWLLVESMPEIAADTFDRANGAIGSDWTVGEGSYNVDTNLAEAGTAGMNTAVWNGTNIPLTPDYVVEADVVLNSSSSAGVVARYTDTSNYYTAVISSFSQDLELYKNVAGSFTSLGTYAGGFSTSVTYKLKMDIRGGSINVYVDGVNRVSVSDTAITAVGLPGILSDTSGNTLDNFHAWGDATTNPGGGPGPSTTIARHLTLLGVS